jgi:hypothetical protein
MKVKELINELKNWPEDAEVEMAIPVDLHSLEPFNRDMLLRSDKIWLEIEINGVIYKKEK